MMMMMNAASPQLHSFNSPQPPSSLLQFKPLVLSHGSRSPAGSCLPTRRSLRVHGRRMRFSVRSRATSSSSDVKGVEASKEKAVSVKATVRATAPGLLSNLDLTKPFDVYADLVGKSLLLELASADLDSGKLLPDPTSLLRVQASTIFSLIR